MVLNDSLSARSERIKLLICDVDGVLTDGRLYMTETGEHMKVFHVQDGSAIKRLKAEFGIEAAIISGRDTPMVTQRGIKLGMNAEDIYQGIEDKIACYEELKTRHNVTDEEVAYIGDDHQDMDVMNLVGLAIAVNNARPRVKEIAHWITPSNGGEGVVADTYDMIFEMKQRLTLSAASSSTTLEG